MKYFGTIEPLVCCKMWSKNFKIGWQIEKKFGQKHFWIWIFCTKISWKGGKYFPSKILNSFYFIIIAQNHYKMTQITYHRQNLHDQAFFFLKVPIFMILSALPMQKFLFKIHFGHENFFICWPIFKFFAGPIKTKQDIDFDIKRTFLCYSTLKSYAKSYYQRIFVYFSIFAVPH